MWHRNDKGQQEFSGGKEAWDLVARIAENCPHFKPDDEDEMVAEELLSCYNCRYRRWTAKSFMCFIVSDTIHRNTERDK